MAEIFKPTPRFSKTEQEKKYKPRTPQPHHQYWLCAEHKFEIRTVSRVFTHHDETAYDTVVECTVCGAKP